MEKTWSYLVNPILNATVSSYIRFFVISTFHYERLKAKAGQPFFDDLLKIYEPFHLAFVAAYNDWKAAGGLQIGSTAEMDEVLGQLSHDKAEQWDLDVQHVYRRDTPHYLALLPHHRQVFQNGSALERISAISAFSKAIGTDAALAAVKADVDAFHTHTTDIASHKDGKQGDTKFSSEAVEAARVEQDTTSFVRIFFCLRIRS